jgi:hypothetical protein
MTETVAVEVVMIAYKEFLGAKLISKESCFTSLKPVEVVTVELPMKTLSVLSCKCKWTKTGLVSPATNKVGEVVTVT